ncbi:MAG: hypothetical protein IKI64_04960 [Clostridia bacterium]|nr:hypothetical protein [Clostridia bacterium]
MSKTTRIISLLLAAIMCFGLIPVGAFAETRSTRTEGGVTIESEYDSAFDYLERYYDGVWRDLHTTRHWIAETGEDVYCIEHTMHSPHGDEYVETNPSMLLQADTIEGLFSIFTFGYPFVTPDGFTADEARQATANAIRFWLSEQGEPGSYQYTNRLLFPDLIRAKPGYEHVLIWADELLEHARNRDTLRYGISFDPAHLDLTNTGSGFSGQIHVTLLNANGGYTLDTASFPAGVTVSGYTGNGSETITISAPLSAAGNSFTLKAEALDSRVVDNMTAYVPTSANTQSVFLCASSTQVVASASVTVNTEALGGLKIIKKGDNGSLLSGVKFGVYSDNACTQLIAEITTGANGVAVLDNIAPGTVYVKELSTVAPYIINSTVHTAVIPLNDIIEIEVMNESAKGRIRIEKTAESMSAVHTNDSNWGTIHTPVYTEGGLAGCKFEIKDSNGNIVETLVTDENGVAVSKLLPLGTYTVFEIEAPNGYIIDATPHTITLSYQDQVTPVVSANVRVNNERRRAMLKLKKQSEEYDSESHEFKPIPGVGFTFGLYTAERIGKLPKDALVEVLITDSRGVAQTSADLPAGRYYLKELAAPDPAVILLEVQLPVDLTGNDAVIENTYYFDNPIVNHIFKGKLAVKKIDEHTGEGLAGVVYEVKDSDGKPVCTLTTNRVGYAESDYLPAGTYYLKEIEAPAGYIISDEVYSVTITTGNSEPVVIQITNRKNEVIISKFDIASSEPLAGAAFSIYDANGELFASGVTDENGEIRLSGLPTGRYTFVETAAPSGYILSEHIYEFSVDEHGNISGSTAAYDEPTALIIDKIDVSTGKPLADVEFKLLNSKGEVVRTKMTAEGFRIPDEKGDETFRVDANGHAEFRYLPIGEYSIVEITPAGFIPNGKVNVSIDNDNGISNPATIRIENIPTALIIDKIDVSTGKPLADVEFKLINSKGEVVKTKMTTAGYRIPDEKGDETFRVDSTGHMEFRYLPIGEYSIIEITPAGFIPNGKVSVTVGSNNGISNPATVRIENTPTALIIDKIDVSTGKPLADVEFRLLNSKGEVVRTKMTSEGFRIPDEKGDETFRVDSTGHMEFRYLPIGTYAIVEVTPVGFIPNDKVSVEIGNTNGINNPAKVRIENMPTALNIDKIDVSTGKPLADVEFRLLNARGEIVKTRLTREGYRIPDENGSETFRVDENGHAEFRYLPIGTYTVVEVTPVGFIPNDKVSVEIGSTNGINNPAQVRIENMPTALIIDKVDIGTGKPLADVEFRLLNARGETVKTRLTRDGYRVPDENGSETFRVDENGHAEFRYLPIGSYMIEEIAPVGFIPNGKVNVTISNDNGISNPATVRIENTPTALIIDKIDASTGKPLAGVEFRLLNARGETVKTRLTREGYRVPDENGSETFRVDENGHAEFRYLPIGRYTIEEIAPVGFIPNDKVSVEIGSTNGINNPAQVRIENMHTALIIDKVDVSTGRPLADVEFRLLNARGETVKTRLTRDGYRVPDENGSESFRVDENGHAEFRYLPIGSYTIEEIAPVGFIPNEPVFVSITDENGIDNPAAVKIANIPTALIIEKVDASTGKPMANIEFKLVDANGETVKTKLTEEGYRIPTEDGDETFFTDENGYAEFRYLPIGEYSIVEIMPEGFIPNEPVSVAIGSDNGIESPAKVIIENTPTALIVEKVDAYTGKPLAGVEFTLVNARGEIVRTSLTDNGYRVPDPEGNETFMVDENGSAEFRYLPIGEYSIIENTPAGYITAVEVSVSIETNNGIDDPAKIVISNSPTGLIIHKVDKDTGLPLTGAGFSINIMDGDGFKALTFNRNADGSYTCVFDGSGKYITLMVDENGNITVYGLPLGMVWLEETVVPEGYFPISAQSVEITAEHSFDKPVELIVSNSVFVKLGLDDDKYEIPAMIGGCVLAVCAATGFVVSVIAKRRNKKED